MGYNISEATGTFTGSPGSTPGIPDDIDNWTFTIDLSASAATTVSGNFDIVPPFFGNTDPGGGYTFSPLNTTAFGSLSTGAAGAFTFTIDRDAVFASGSDQSITFTIVNIPIGGDADTDTVTINILICVLRGTRITTPEGDLPVEDLRPGDLVLTADGRAEPVRWIGSRRLSRAELAANPSLRPIRIAADAFRPGRPGRDLRVSPQHRILLEGWRAELLFGEDRVLVPAKGLVDDGPIRVDHGSEAVEYFHILFDRHEIILTEGQPSESFQPGAYALDGLEGSARDEVLRLFPELDRGGACLDAAEPGLRPWEARLLAGRSLS